MSTPNCSSFSRLPQNCFGLSESLEWLHCIFISIISSSYIKEWTTETPKYEYHKDHMEQKSEGKDFTNYSDSQNCYMKIINILFQAKWDIQTYTLWQIWL